MLWFLDRNLWNALNTWIKPDYRNIVRFIVYGLGLIPIVLSIFADILPTKLEEALHDFFYYHLLILLYLFIITLCIIGINKLLVMLGVSLLQNNPWLSLLGIFLCIASTGSLMGLGVYNASVPQLTHHDLTIKKASPHEKIRLMAISDIHWETLMNGDVLTRAIDIINKRKPDVLVILGDSVTMDEKSFIENDVAGKLASIETTYGTYVVTGNHDFYITNIENLIQAYRQAGITPLRDEVILIADSIWLIGREDIGGMRNLERRSRATIDELLNQTNRDQTLILLDHQPRDLSLNATAGIDLMLSGHTHAGQIWPVTMITERINDLNYGLKKIGESSFYVTSGIGYWGPPLRLGSRAEVVEFDIFFEQP